MEQGCEVPEWFSVTKCIPDARLRSRWIGEGHEVFAVCAISGRLLEHWQELDNLRGSKTIPVLVRFNQALQHGHVPIRVTKDPRQLETEIQAIQGNMKRVFTAA